MSLNEKLQKFVSDSKSDWVEETGKKMATRGARKNARKVALRVLQFLHEQGISQTELATRMGVSRQQVAKIVKGQENFTFETIDKLEKALNVQLMTIEVPRESMSMERHRLSGVVSVPAGSLVGFSDYWHQLAQSALPRHPYLFGEIPSGLCVPTDPFVRYPGRAFPDFGYASSPLTVMLINGVPMNMKRMMMNVNRVMSMNNLPVLRPDDALLMGKNQMATIGHTNDYSNA